MSDDIKTLYPGLRAYSKNEKDIFFGREDQISNLINRLSSSRFIAVVGTSGCGKSSLVNAGLIPAFEEGSLVHPGDKWKYATLHPGSQPLKKLTKALLNDTAIGKERAHFKNNEMFLLATLKSSSFGLIDAIDETPLEENTNLVIIVDQFEEIFRSMHIADNNEVRAFVYLLIETIKLKKYPIYVVITMRSDFIGECASFYNLSEIVAKNLFLTPRLRIEQLRDIIIKPGEKNGATVEPKLVSKLINDMESDQDQLPLLQHILMRMWVEYAQESNKFTFEDYKKIGELKNGLSEHGNLIYNSLINDQQKEITKKLFKCLVDNNNKYSDMRRSITLEEASKIINVKPLELEEIVKKFSRQNHNFLNVSKNDNVIDISHESLIRQWDTLKEWADQENNAVKIYFDLKENINLLKKNWKSNSVTKQKNDSEVTYFDIKNDLQSSISITKHYLNGFSLEKALDWIDKTKPNEYWVSHYDDNINPSLIIDEIKEFINDSEKYEKYEKEKKEQQEKSEQKRKINRNRNIAIGIFLFSILITFFSIWINNEKNKQVKNLFESYLTHSSLQIKINNYEKARKILNNSKKLDNNIMLGRIRARNIMHWYTQFISAKTTKIFQIQPHAQIKVFAVSNDERLLIAGTNDGIIIWYDLSEHRVIDYKNEHKDLISAISMNDQKKIIASADNNGLIIFWSYQGKKLWQWDTKKEQKNIDEEKPDNEITKKEQRIIDEKIPDNEIHTINEKSKESKEYTKKTILLSDYYNNKFHIKLSSDGENIAYGFNSIIIRKVNKRGEFVTKKPLYPQYSINDIAFSKNSNFLAIASYSEVYLWNNNSELDLLYRDTCDIISLCFIPKFNLLAASTSETIHIIDYIVEKPKYDISGIGSDISMSGIDKSGNITIVTSDRKIVVKSIKNEIIKILQGHDCGIVGFSHTDKHMFTLDTDGIINQWNNEFNNGNFFKEINLNDEPKCLAISSDGLKMVIGFTGGNIQLRDLESLKTIWQYQYQNSISKVLFNHNTKQVAFFNNDNNVTILDAENGNKISNKKINNNITNFDFSPDSKFIAISGKNGSLCLYNVLQNSINERVIPEFQNYNFNSIMFNHKGKKLLTSCDNGSIQIWQIPNFTIVNHMSVSKNYLNFASFDNKDQNIVCGGRDQRIKVITDLDNKNFFSFYSHDNEVLKAKFIFDDQVVSIGNDRYLRIFDIPSKTELLSIKLPITINDYPVNDLDIKCFKDKCLATVALNNYKILVYTIKIN